MSWKASGGGELYLATISLQDSIVGFITCIPAKARHENLKVDVYIGLLAMKQFIDFKSGNKIRIGLGKELIESVQSRFFDANAITLDTRLINSPAMSFYEKLGFTCTGRRTFAEVNPDYYTGYEKSVMRKV